MKKNYLLIAAAAAMFAACTQNDVINEIIDENVAIGFEGKYVNKVTRAEITNTWFANSDQNSFGVYGYRINGTTHEGIFSNEQVTWDNTNKDWKHTTIRFWDKSKAYNFYAYAPYAANATWDGTNEKFSFNGLSIIKPIDAIDDKNTEDTSDDTPAVTDIAIAIKRGVYYSQTLTTANPGHNAQNPEDGASANGHHNGDVEFEFHHILSKLAFLAKTSISSTVAEIKIRSIDLDFPTATSVLWAQNANNNVAGATTYTGYAAKNGIDANGDPIYANFETPVFSGTTAVLTSTASTIADAQTTTNVAKTFIVTPVATSGDGTEHIFGIKVTYDVKYKSDNHEELGCIATGVIGGDPEVVTKQYKPSQNSSYVVTIDVNPAKIEFCVDKIASWDATTGREVIVE